MFWKLRFLKFLVFFFLVFINNNLALAKKSSYSLNLKSDLMAWNSGVNGAFDVKLKFVTLGLFFKKFSGDKRVKIEKESTYLNTQELGSSLDVYFNGQGLSSSVILGLHFSRAEGTAESSRVSTDGGYFCRVDSRSSGVLFNSTLTGGMAWFSRYGLNMIARAGATYVVPTPSYEYSLETIGCEVPLNQVPGKKSNWYPVLAIELGLAI